MTRDEAIAKLVASGKYTPETAAAALDARKASKAEAPKKAATPAKAKAAPVAKPADPASEDVTDVGAVAAPGPALAWHGPEVAPSQPFSPAGKPDTPAMALLRRANALRQEGAQRIALAREHELANTPDLSDIAALPGQYADAIRAKGRQNEADYEIRRAAGADAERMKYRTAAEIDRAERYARVGAQGRPGPPRQPNPLELANAWSERSADLNRRYGDLVAAAKPPPPTPPSKGFTPTVTYEVGAPTKDERAVMRSAMMSNPTAFGFTAEEIKAVDDEDVTTALGYEQYRKLAGL